MSLPMSLPMSLSLSLSLTPTRLAALILAAALAALPLVAALPARAGGFGQTSDAAGQFSPLTPTGVHSSDDGEVRDLADRLGGTDGTLATRDPHDTGH